MPGIPTIVQPSLQTFRSEMKAEAMAILDYWISNTVDTARGGFYGAINYRNETEPLAPRGIVLYSRICWSFSAAYSVFHDPRYLSMAERAFRYIADYFWDESFGGVFWSVDSEGRPLDTRKQIYGLAFCIYGLSEYYRASGNPEALDKAIALFEKIEIHSFDTGYGGYFEAFSREWQSMDDMRLSEKDDNEKKTMNTHLHVVEAYANLYTVWPEARLRERVNHLLDLFEKYFVDPRSYHLRLFYDEAWNLRSSLISYGHDIEAAWLLADCARQVGDPERTGRLAELGTKIAMASLEGLDSDGGLWYEYEPSTGQLIREKHSWPQAEAMIGFLFAYQHTNDAVFLERAMACWEFVKEHILDRNTGEWFWGVLEDYSPMPKDKAGFWKCPYHNTRACLEIIKRIETLEKN